MSVRLSVIIITMNEALNIRDCLESVRWADEIVVLDSGSSDDTLNICREFPVRIHCNSDWQGFGVQKNRALALATGDWVLSLDADERITSASRSEIQEAIAAPAGDVHEMPRSSWFCGRRIRHSGWSPDYVPRLFRRGLATFSDDTVHERLCFDGKPTRLCEPIEHISYRSLEQVLDKMNRYSSAGAGMLLKRGRRGTLRTALSHGIWAFLRTYVLRRGFLDGREGFILAVFNAETTYYRYLKRMYLDERE